jgi:trk system potassium uptake protein TrkH
MRKGVIQRIISRLLWFTVVAQLVPMIVAILYWENSWWPFCITAVASAALAVFFAHRPAAKKAPQESLRRREGFVAVLAGWLLLVFISAIAFYMTGEFDGFAKAFFESMSGFTTTGASIFPGQEIEQLPHSILFMRSFSHWIGGMGIIVLSVAILPELAVGGMQLFSMPLTTPWPPSPLAVSLPRETPLRASILSTWKW